MYQCCYLRFECLHNQFYVIGLIGILPRASKWLEMALITDKNFSDFQFSRGLLKKNQWDEQQSTKQQDLHTKIEAKACVDLIH